jgi:hypothetical protein
LGLGGWRQHNSRCSALLEANANVSVSNSAPSGTKSLNNRFFGCPAPRQEADGILRRIPLSAATVKFLLFGDGIHALKEAIAEALKQ